MTDPKQPIDEPDVEERAEGLPDVMESYPDEVPPDEGDKGKP